MATGAGGVEKFFLGGGSGGLEGSLSKNGGATGERTYVNDPMNREWRYGNPRLVYRTEPMSSPMELTGPLSMHLVASSRIEDTDWIVTLLDESPNGEVRILTKGCLWASHRALDEKNAAR